MKVAELRSYRNSKVYRSLARTFRVYNRMVVTSLHESGFTDFSPAFPQIMSNLDTEGTRIGVLAQRAGITRQAAGQLVAEIERVGYVERRAAPDDARATVVHFTPLGRKLLARVFVSVEEIEGRFAEILGKRGYESMRDALQKIADELDPNGGLGPDDE